MSAAVAPMPRATTAQILKTHDALARYVHGNFKRKLSFEEARDVAAVTLAEADRAIAGGCEIRDLKQWLRTAAWRNALDAIRRSVGEGRVPRERPVEFDVRDLGEAFSHRPDEDVLHQHAAADDARALRAAWKRLSPDEQRALHLRYFDELPVPAVLELLDCTRDQYENLTKRALRKLRDALVGGAREDACRRCRALVLQAQDAALSPAKIVERDAHLSGCLWCRAFARRASGLIALLPLPAVGIVDRVLTRLQAHAAGSSGAGQAGEAAAGSAALAGAGAVAVGSGSAGAGLMSAAGGSALAKIVAVVCSAGAVTATVCLPSGMRDAPHPRTVAAAPSAAPARGGDAAAAPRTTAPTAAAPVTNSTPAHARRAFVAPPRRRDDRRRDAADQRADASPFLPDSAVPAPKAARQAAPRVQTFDAASGPASAEPAPARATTASGSFSQEFAP